MRTQCFVPSMFDHTSGICRFDSHDFRRHMCQANDSILLKPVIALATKKLTKSPDVKLSKIRPGATMCPTCPSRMTALVLPSLDGHENKSGRSLIKTCQSAAGFRRALHRERTSIRRVSSPPSVKAGELCAVDENQIMCVSGEGSAGGRRNAAGHTDRNRCQYDARCAREGDSYRIAHRAHAVAAPDWHRLGGDRSYAACSVRRGDCIGAVLCFGLRFMATHLRSHNIFVLQ